MVQPLKAPAFFARVFIEDGVPTCQTASIVIQSRFVCVCAMRARCGRLESWRGEWEYRRHLSGIYRRCFRRDTAFRRAPRMEPTRVFPPFVMSTTRATHPPSL